MLKSAKGFHMEGSSGRVDGTTSVRILKKAKSKMKES
jgi:hypothetical protein